MEPRKSKPGAAETRQFDDPAQLLLMEGDQHPVDDAGLEELADSMRVNGQLHAITVRCTKEGRYEILAGRRRWLAAKKAKLPILATVLRDCDDRRAHEIRVAENAQRQELSAYETACSLRNLRNQNDWGAPEVAAAVGLSSTRVRAYLALFNGSDRLLDFLRKERLGLDIATELVRYERQWGEGAAWSIAKKVAAGDCSIRELRTKRGKRRGTAGQRKATRDTKWQGVEVRVTALAKEDGADTLRRLRDLLTQLEAGKDGAVARGAPSRPESVTVA
jgi:ParB/RepB/Spo0J family partition protein